MAQHMLTPPSLSFVNKRKSSAGKSVADGGINLTTPANYVDNTSLDARLIAMGYTQKRVDSMTQNDKVYAIRLNDDTSSI